MNDLVRKEKLLAMKINKALDRVGDSTVRESFKVRLDTIQGTFNLRLEKLLDDLDEYNNFKEVGK